MAAEAVQVQMTCGEGIQVFGGIGYTFENDMHLYLKRAHVFRHLFGEPTDVLAELLAQDRAQ